MIGFSLIGTPAGYDSLHAGLNTEIDVDSYVDLNNQAINIFPNTSILRFIKIARGIDICYVFVSYNYALEIKNTRPGSYYGSVITFKNSSLPDAKYILNSLHDLNKIIKHNCLDANYRFFVKIREIKETKTPESVKQLSLLTNTHIPNYNSDYSTEHKQIFFSNEDNNKENIVAILNRIIKDELFEDYENIYLSESNEVLEYVLKKGLLQVSTYQELKVIKQNNIKKHLKIINKLKEEKEFLTSENIRLINENVNLLAFKNSINSSLKSIDKVETEDNLLDKQNDKKPWFRLSSKYRVVGLITFFIITTIFLLVHYHNFIWNIINEINNDNNNVISSQDISGKNFNNSNVRNDRTPMNSIKDTLIFGDDKIDSEKHTLISECDGSNTKLWVYNGKNNYNLTELTNYILQNISCNNCVISAMQISKSLRVCNPSDIVLEKITKYGNLCFRLPLTCEIISNESFSIKQTKK